MRNKDQKGKSSWAVEWSAVRTGVITGALVACLGVIVRWSGNMGDAALMLIVWLVSAVAIGAGAFAIDRRTRRIEAALGPVDSDAASMPLRQRLEALAMDVALVEADRLVKHIDDGASDAVRGDAVELVGGARLARWTVKPGEVAGLVALELTPPSWVDVHLTFCCCTPLTRERVNELGKFLAAHGVPVTRLSTEQVDQATRST